MSNEIKIAFLGCGHHVQESHCFEPKGMKIHGVYDPNVKNIEKMEEKLGRTLIHYTSESHLLEDIDVSAVFIGNSSKFHADSLNNVINAGKHVFIEKPIAVNRDQIVIAAKAIKKAKEKGLVVLSCYPRRLEEVLDKYWICNNINIVVLGEALQFSYDFSYPTPKHWNNKVNDRSLMIDHINQDIDMMNMLCGKSNLKYGVVLKDVPLEYFVNGIREDGIGFQFHGSRFLSTRCYSETITIRYEKGEIRLDLERGIMEVRFDEANLVETFQARKMNYDYHFVKMITHFVDLLRNPITAIPYVTLEEIIYNNNFAFLLKDPLRVVRGSVLEQDIVF